MCIYFTFKPFEGNLGPNLAVKSSITSIDWFFGLYLMINNHKIETFDVFYKIFSLTTVTLASILRKKLFKFIIMKKIRQNLLLKYSIRSIIIVDVVVGLLWTLKKINNFK